METRAYLKNVVDKLADMCSVADTDIIYNIHSENALCCGTFSLITPALAL